MILTGSEIVKQVKKNKIFISPFNEDLINPNSYNYRLNYDLIEFESVLDFKEKSNFKRITLTEEGYLLSPNKLYLASTFEKIGSNKFVTHLIGRSSIGRLGLFLQVSAQLGHVGTNTNWTLELKVVQPLKIYPLMKIGQVSFWTVKGKSKINYENGYYRPYEKAQISKFYKEF